MTINPSTGEPHLFLVCLHVVLRKGLCPVFKKKSACFCYEGYTK